MASVAKRHRSQPGNQQAHPMSGDTMHPSGGSGGIRWNSLGHTGETPTIHDRVNRRGRGGRIQGRIPFIRFDVTE